MRDSPVAGSAGADDEAGVRRLGSRPTATHQRRPQVSAVSAELALPPEVVRELRSALVAELNAFGKEILVLLPPAPFTLKRVADAGLAARLNSRLGLLAIVGWPGEHLPEDPLTLAGAERCALTIETLGAYRDREAERLASGEVLPGERLGLERRVRLLSVFLTDYALRVRTPRRAPQRRRVMDWLARTLRKLPAGSETW